MNLQDDLIKSFAQAINQSGGGEPGERSVYAQVIRVEETEQGKVVFIRIDGSTVDTPATSMVEVGEGDRVFATIKSHSVVVTGNISYPSLTRVGNIYITLTADGLVIGMLDEDNVPVGYRILISPDDTNPGIYIIDDQNRVISTFGTTIRIGKPNSYNVVISDSGMTILDALGNTIATYGSNVKIGKDGQNTLTITGTSVINESYGNWSVFRAKSYSGAGGGQVSDYSFCSDLAGGGGIYRGNSGWVIHFDSTTMEIGPTSQKKLRISTTESIPTIGGTKIGMVGDYIKTKSSSYSFSGGSHNRHTITMHPTIPSGYTLLGVTQIYIGSNDWVVGTYYIPTGTNDITVRINTVDGENKTDPNSLIVNYIMVRTS